MKTHHKTHCITNNDETLADLLKRVTVPDALYARYLEQAVCFLNQVKSVDPQRLPFHNPRFVRSELFGVKYLVVNFCSDDPMALNNEAYASPATEVCGWTAPPLVYIRKRNRSPRRLYRSVLEHEFVHINQILVGDLLEWSNEADAPVRFLTHRARLELEAMRLQFFHYPEVYANLKLPTPLDPWCQFTSYFGALQKTLGFLLECGEPQLTTDFLRSAWPQLWFNLMEAGFTASEVHNYFEHFPDDVVRELMELLEGDDETPQAARAPFGEWLQRVGYFERAAEEPGEERAA